MSLLKGVTAFVNFLTEKYKIGLRCAKLTKEGWSRKKGRCDSFFSFFFLESRADRTKVVKHEPFKKPMKIKIEVHFLEMICFYTVACGITEYFLLSFSKNTICIYLLISHLSYTKMLKLLLLTFTIQTICFPSLWKHSWTSLALSNKCRPCLIENWIRRKKIVDSKMGFQYNPVNLLTCAPEGYKLGMTEIKCWGCLDRKTFSASFDYEDPP